MNQDHTGIPELDTEVASSIESRLNGGIDELSAQAAGAYEDTKTAILGAYKRTSSAAQSGYKRTLEYGTEHPHRFGLVTFAVGLGAGALLAVTTFAGRRTRTERIAVPLIDVVAEVVRSVLRR